MVPGRQTNTWVLPMAGNPFLADDMIAKPAANPFMADDMIAKPQAQPTTPNWEDYLMAGPGGALLQPSARAGNALIGLAAHSASDLADLGGHFPNPVADKLRQWTDSIDQWRQNQERAYQAARDKFTNPASKAFEIAGSVVPAAVAGAIGGAPAAADSTLGNIAQGALSGAKGGAAMGVMSGDSAGADYWSDTAKRAAAGALTGAVTGGALGATSPKAAPPVNPTADLKQQASDLYQRANNAGVIVKADSLKQFSGDISKAISEEGLSRRLHPGALGALQDIQDAATSGQPITLKGLDLLRQNVGDVSATAQTAGERRLAGVIRDKMDSWMQGLGANDVISGDPQAATGLLSQARDLWSTYKKSALIDDLVDGAKNRSNFTASGYENALRTEFRSLAQNNAKMRQFTPEEQDAIRTVVRGGPVDNFFRAIGRFAVRGPLSGLVAGGANAAVPGAGFALSGIGEGARHMATQGTQQNIENVYNAIRGMSLPKAPAPVALPGPGIIGNPSIFRLLQSSMPNLAIPPMLYASNNAGGQ